MKIETHMYDVETLSAGDVTLRAIDTSDAHEIYDYARRKDVVKYMLWGAHRNVEDSLRFIQYIAKMNQARRRIDWCIVENKTNRVIGSCGLAVRSPEGEVLEIGYVLHPDFWNLGYATAAAAAMRDFVFQNTTCQRLEGRYFTDNAASGRVLEKIGMNLEGVHRKEKLHRGKWLDVGVYAMMRGEWESMRPRDRKAGVEKIRAARCFAFDMDGTIYLGDRVLSGAHEVMALLKERGVRTVFLTNNSSRSTAEYVKRLNGMGFNASADDIISSGQAAAAYLKREYPEKRVFVMGTEALISEMRESGVNIVEEDAEVVLAGFDMTLTYQKLVRICDYVRAGLPFVATHPDFNCPTDGGFVPDLGSILALIEKSTGRTPDKIIGKPHSEIAEYLIERTGVAREEIVMIGDRLYTDVATGVQNGMVSVLVLSGETQREQLARSRVQPDLVARGVDEIYEILSGEHLEA